MIKIKVWLCMPLILLLALMLFPTCADAATIKAISAGDGSMVLMDDGTVYAWGNNATHSVPEKVQGLTDITAISTYRCNYMALKADGTVYMWSWIDNEDTPPRLVQVPITGVKAISVPVMLKEDGTVWEIVASNPNIILDPDFAVNLNIREVTGLDNVIAIGNQVALEGDGSVWVWGAARNFMLGEPTGGDLSPIRIDISDVKAIAATNLACLALKNDGTIWAFGQNCYGLFGTGNWTKWNQSTATPVQTKGISNVVSISAAVANAMALKDDGTVWLWGSDNFNVLGIYGSPGALTPRKLDSLDNVMAIALGDYHCMALKNDGSLWAWGANFQGQLGDGTVTPPLEHGGGKDKPVKVLIDTSGPYSASASPTVQVTPSSSPVSNVTVGPASSNARPSSNIGTNPATGGLPLGDGVRFIIMAIVALIIACGFSLTLKKK